MKRNFSIQSFVGVAIILLCVPSVNADPILNVFASSAPNGVSSSSFIGYNANALNSLENDLGDIGDRDIDPEAYERFDDGEFIELTDLIVSNFNSWRGLASPSGPFQSETGNRLHFGLHIVGDGLTQFRLDNLLWDIDSTDIENSLDVSGDFVGLSFNQFRIGIDWGADRMKGGGDDSVFSTGSGTQLIDELVYVGVGNAYDASGKPGPTDQERLDQAIEEVVRPLMIIGTYTLNDDDGNTLGEGTTKVQIVPEPNSAILIACFSILATMRRRRK